MPLFYITGISGSGKSSVIDELSRSGYNAHDIDDIAAWFNEDTKQFEPDSWFDTSERGPDFYKTYTWKVPREKVENLVKQAASKAIVMAGAVGNENEIVDLFDRIIALDIDNETLRHRLLTRTTNDYGKNPVELEMSLGWNKAIHEKYKEYDYTIIDATRPLEAVVSEIKELISTDGDHS